MEPSGGWHHVTAITGRGAENHAFYTGALGMRLVKKTVNQENTAAYHLFYADEDAGCLGETLSLPLFLEDQRAAIESQRLPLRMAVSVP